MEGLMADGAELPGPQVAPHVGNVDEADIQAGEHLADAEQQVLHPRACMLWVRGQVADEVAGDSVCKGCTRRIGAGPFGAPIRAHWLGHKHALAMLAEGQACTLHGGEQGAVSDETTCEQLGGFGGGTIQQLTLGKQHVPLGISIRHVCLCHVFPAASLAGDAMHPALHSPQRQAMSPFSLFQMAAHGWLIK